MEALDEELIALEAIYPECLFRDFAVPQRLTIHPLSNSSISLTLEFPPEYPDKQPSIVALSGTSQSLVQEVLDSSWSPGEVCLYVLIDTLRDLFDANLVQTSSASQEDAEVIAEYHTSRSESDDDKEYEFAISDPIVDRKSVFVGRAIEVDSKTEAMEALLWLKRHDKKVAKATHNMFAWRVVENGVLMQDNDDDGEDAAGSRLAHLLEIMDIKNVMVIVTRWYGGILLYGDRFKHISNAGREALRIGGFLPEEQDFPSKKGAKKTGNKKR